MSTIRWNRQNKQLEKQCSNCEEYFPATAEYFYRQKTAPDGLMYSCKECRKAYMAERREANREDYRGYVRKWRERNRKQHARYRENNRIRIRKREREYRARNRHIIRAKTRERYADNPELYKRRARQSAQQNHERVKANKRTYYQQTKHITPEMREAAGEWAGENARMPDGRIVRVIARDDRGWIVRLHDPIKVGSDQYQNYVRVSQIREI